jgi:hypothetical protein
VWAAVALAVLGAAGVTAWALSSGSAAAPPHHAASTTTSTSTTSTSTTTTTLPTVTSAADALSHDVNAGVTSGAISSKAGKAILDDLNSALAASSNGQQDQAASALNAMAGTIGREQQLGTMTPAEASTLSADVSKLATALGLPAPSTTTTTSGTTSTSSTASGGEGNGNGH